MSPDEAIDRLRSLRGPRAIQSAKQFNFVQDYRDLRDEHEERNQLSR